MTPEIQGVLDTIANVFIPGFSQMEKLANGESLNEGDYGEIALDIALALLPGGALIKGGKGAAKAVAKAGTVPGFADGTVFQPNRPVLGIFGDNRREVEVASPYSTIVQAVQDALRGLTASARPAQSYDDRPIELTVNLDGRTVARTIYDPLENERRRRNGSVSA
jgi:hypothetical protein